MKSVETYGVGVTVQSPAPVKNYKEKNMNIIKGEDAGQTNTWTLLRNGECVNLWCNDKIVGMIGNKDTLIIYEDDLPEGFTAEVRHIER